MKLKRHYAETVFTLTILALFIAAMTSAFCQPVQAVWMEAEVFLDAIDEFGKAEVSEGARASLGQVREDRQMNYPLLGRYLFLHPPSGESATATALYSIALPAVRVGERILLLFAVGLRPGWRDAGQGQADGVIFRVLVNGQSVYEQLWDKDGWCYAAVNLNQYAGKNVRLALVSDCNKNSSADWALWGDPRVVLLRPAQRAYGVAQPSFFVLRAPPEKEVTADWPSLGENAKGVIIGDNRAFTNVLGWFPSPLSIEKAPRLPRMRLADGSEPTLQDVAAVLYAPKIEVTSVGPSAGVVTPYDRFQIVAVLTNTGEGALTAEHGYRVRLAAPLGFALSENESPEKILPAVKPSEEVTLAWRVTAPPERGLYRFGLGMGLQVQSFEVTVLGAGRGIEYGFLTPDTTGFHERPEFVVLEKGSTRLALIREAGRFVYGTLLVKTESLPGQGRWKPIGRLSPFGELTVRLRDGKTQRIELRPSGYSRLRSFGGRSLTDEEVGVALQDTFSDADSVRWRFEQSFLLRKDSPWVETETSLIAESTREVVLFVSPKLLAGDGVEDFGGSKDQAIFPGLEYLGENEPSSSTRDIASPQNRRATPHPLRVTIPMMAVRKENVVLGLSWNPHQNWHQAKELPTPLFSSPNRFPPQNNHAFSVIVPTVPEFLEEGTLNSRRVLSIAPETTVRLNSSILILPQATDITDAVVAWVKRHGFPEVRYPRNLDEELSLCRHGYLESVWDASAEGWSHCVGWQPGPYPGHCTPLSIDLLLTREDEVRQALRQRIDRVVGKCLERFGPGSLWRPDACHIMTGELPFLEGRLAECVDNWQRATEGLLGRQSPDGSFRWQPSDARQEVLGKPGDTTSGMCARGACQLLREAIVTGDRRHIEASLKALAFLDRYMIPTGAQEWECPLYAPDVLAAAYAVRAFVHAYEITGEERYLEKAKFWAKTGIPFHYLWERDEQMPQMKYAGIPIFGATFYTHSWLGRPVQWCSLVYAYSLQRLARHDDSLDWRRLAKGITVSAMWQQYADGKSKGCYPDSWDLLENHPNPADLNPENIAVNLLALNGYDPGLKHKVLNREKNPIFVTSIAEMLSAEMEDERTVRLRVKFFPGAKTYVFLAGLSSPSEPKVFIEDKPLPSTKDVDRAPEGWQYDARKGWLVIGLTHTEKGETLRIRLR